MTFNRVVSSSAAGPPHQLAWKVLLISLCLYLNTKECPHLILGSGLGDRRESVWTDLVTHGAAGKGSITRRQSLEPCAKDLDQVSWKALWTHFPSCAGLMSLSCKGAGIGFSIILDSQHNITTLLSSSLPSLLMTSRTKSQFHVCHEHFSQLSLDGDQV